MSDTPALPERALHWAQRYRSPLLVALAVLVVAVFFPGKPGNQIFSGGDLTGVASASAGTGVAVGATPEGAGGQAVPIGVSPSEPEFAGVPSLPFGAGSLASPTEPSASSSPAPGTELAVAPTTTSAPPPSPLRVIDSGWAQGALTNGTAVPDHGLPAEVQAGETQRMSFVRLSGVETVLRMPLVRSSPGPTGDQPVIAACPITTPDWKGGTAQSLDDAPAYDDTACVTGTEKLGVVQFDLGKFSNRTGKNGFALVPVAEVGAFFEIVLSRNPA